MSSILPDLVSTLYAIAQDAARAILAEQAKGLTIISKDDGSITTSADLAAEAVILSALDQQFPDIPCIAEETRAGPTSTPLPRFFLIDPIDGTRGFSRGSASYTINIGLIENGVPIAGVIIAPAKGRSFVAADNTAYELHGSDWRVLKGADPVVPPRIGLISHSRDDDAAEMLRQAGVDEVRPVSSSLKFGLLAAGEAHVYARGHFLMIWDTAAGDAIVRAAGGMVTDPKGAPLVYCSTDVINPAFIAWSRAQ